MLSTPERWREVITLVRHWGFPMVEVPGWETRGRGSLHIDYYLWHHTAGPRKGDAPSLRVCTFGRPGLRNSLCNTYTSRSGVIHMVGARRAWQAGRGIITSNSRSGGNEGENTGLGDERWADAHYSAQVALAAAICIVFGLTVARNIDHKEHAPRRKIDRALIAPAQFRADVASFLASHHPFKEDEDMTKIVQVDGYLYHVGGIHAAHIATNEAAEALRAMGVLDVVWPGTAEEFIDAYVLGDEDTGPLVGLES